jgi:hypothetical protein
LRHGYDVEALADLPRDVPGEGVSGALAACDLEAKLPGSVFPGLALPLLLRPSEGLESIVILVVVEVEGDCFEYAAGDLAPGALPLEGTSLSPGTPLSFARPWEGAICVVRGRGDLLHV